MLLGKKPPEKNGDAPEPIRLTVPLGVQIGLDSSKRMVRLPVVSAAGIGAYTVDVPICVLKSITGEVIKREGENEAKSIGQKSRLVKP